MSLTERVVTSVWSLIEPHLDDAVTAVEEGAKDAAKSGVKSVLAGVVKKIKPSNRERAAKSLIRPFARILEDQFEDHRLLEAENPQFEADVKTFLAHDAVQNWLAEPLESGNPPLEHQLLADFWHDLNLTPLPAEFEWDIVARRYAAKVKGVVEKDPELRAIAQSDTLIAIRQEIERLAGLDSGFRLEGYRARIRSRYGYLKFDSFHVTGSELERSISLWRVFVPQHVKENLPPLELPKEHIRQLESEGELSSAEARALMDEAGLDQYRRRYQDAPVVGSLELLRDPACPYAVLIGDPGAGKSTLLQWLLLEWAEDPKTRPLPLFVELRQCALEKSDWKGDFCQYFSRAADALFAFNAVQLDDHLRTKDSVFLVDGLDEVFDLNQRQALTERVLRFQERYPQARIVVTSRKIGFQKDVWLNSGFRLFTLQDFDAPQIDLFLDQWHALAFGKDAAEINRLKPRLVSAVHEYAPIRELAGNPMLLTMMAVVNRLEPIPRDRRALYERCAELLAHRWDVGHGRMAGPDEQNTEGVATLKCPLDLSDKKTLLEQIAYEMQSGPSGLGGNIIEEERLRSIVANYLSTRSLASEPGRTAREIMHQLRERNFILCFVGGRRYAFVHRTLLEFFCASYFAQRFDGAAILDQVIAPHWRDERWHEVIRLVVAEKAKQPETVRGVIEYLLAQNTVREEAINVLLAADCLIDLRSKTGLGEAKNQLLRALRECFRSPLTYNNHPGDEEQPLPARIQAAAVSRWAALQALDPDGKRAVNELAGDPTMPPFVRRSAVVELSRCWKADPDVLVMLKQRVQADESELVRHSAVEELVRGWKEHREVLPLLKQRVQQDESELVRHRVVAELARGWNADAEVLVLLQQRVQEDGSEFVRYSAVAELAQGWKGNPEVLALLLRRAQQDESELVRQSAVEELARGWKEDPVVLARLKELAEFEKQTGRNSPSA